MSRNRKLIGIILLTVLVAGLGTLLYLRWTEARKKVDLWTLVPQDAVVIWESNNNRQFLEHLKDTQIWHTLSQTRYLQRVEETVQLIDSASGPGDSLGRFLKGKPVVVSLHVVSNTDFDLLLYVPIKNVREHRYVRSLTESLGRTGRFTFETRQFLDYEITDVRNKQTGQELSYFSYHNNLVLSPNASLVEQVIRKIERDELVSPAAAYKSRNYLSQRDVWANVFVNYQQVPVFLSLFLSEEVHADLAFLFSLCRSGLLELKLEQSQVFLNGFSLPDTARAHLNRQLQPQKPAALGMKNLLPTRTAVLVHLGNMPAAGLNLPKKRKPAPDPAADVMADSLRPLLRGDLALCWLEAFASGSKPEKLLLAQIAAPERVEALLQEASGAQTGQVSGPGKRVIHLMEVPEFPQRLFGSLFSGFEQTYFAQVDGYLVMTETLPAMQGLLTDIDNEAVWGKSVEQKAFLEQTQQEANLSIFVHTANAWNILTKYLEPARQEDLVKNASLLKRFTQAALQFSKAEDRFYTSYVLQHEARPGQEEQAGAYTLQSSVTFGRSLISRPFLMRNAADKSAEVVVMDSAFTLHLIAADGKRLWADSIGQPLVGEVFQADILNSGTPQYVFATPNRIYALDRQGRMVDDYPFNLSDSVRLQHLAVIEGQRPRDYSLLADDFQGNLYRFNGQGLLMDGWGPRQLGHRLAAPVQHLVVDGQPVFIAILEDGQVYVLNNYGEPLSGFPFSLNEGIKGEVFVRPGSTLRKSQVTVATGSGTVITFNLQGDVVKREQLLKLSRNSRFALLTDAAHLTYVLSRQDLGKLTLFDPDLKQVLDKSYVTSAPKTVQYFQFGSGRRLYVVIERGPQNTYLYNTQGTLLGKRPFDNVLPISVLTGGSGRSYEFFSVKKARLRKVSVEVR